jgi:hypothetical protein
VNALRGVVVPVPPPSNVPRLTRKQLQQSPLYFHVRQVLLALIFSAALFQQPLLAPDALDSHVADWQVELALEPGRVESGQLPAQSQDLLLDIGWGLLG